MTVVMKALEMDRKVLKVNLKIQDWVELKNFKKIKTSKENEMKN